MAEDLNRDRAYKKKKKRILIIVLAIVTLLGAVSYVFTYHGEDVAAFFRSFKKGKNGAHSDYSDELHSYAFFKTDYNLDPTKDETYMKNKTRFLWYQDGAVRVGNPFDDMNLWAEYNDAVRFFVKYFQTILAGDAETYNTFFTERYFRDNKEQERFAPQMIYDIVVEQLSETTGNDGTTEWIFKVSYNIHRNDGSFRNDIPPVDGLEVSGSRPLYFRLIGDASGQVLIDEISRNKLS